MDKNHNGLNNRAESDILLAQLPDSEALEYARLRLRCLMAEVQYLRRLIGEDPQKRNRRQRTK